VSALSAHAAASTSAPPTHLLVTTHECSYDIWSTVKMAVRALTGYYPRIRPGALVTDDYSGSTGSSKDKDSGGVSGGSLFAYELPTRRQILDNDDDDSHSAAPLVHSRSIQWPRHTLCSGFKVKGWGGIFSPGAPGFPYVFNFPQQRSVRICICKCGYF